MIKKLISKVFLIGNIVFIILGSISIYEYFILDNKISKETHDISFECGWYYGFNHRHDLTDTTYTVEQLKKYHSIDSTKLDSILNN